MQLNEGFKRCLTFIGHTFQVTEVKDRHDLEPREGDNDCLTVGINDSLAVAIGLLFTDQLRADDTDRS